MQRIKKGDTVKVLLGKDNGKTGAVERTLPKEGRIFVSGVNMFKRHIKKTGQNEGGVIDVMKSMNLSNVILVCPNCKKGARVGFKIEGKVKSRICKKCGKEIKSSK